MIKTFEKSLWKSRCSYFSTYSEDLSLQIHHKLEILQVKSTLIGLPWQTSELATQCAVENQLGLPVSKWQVGSDPALQKSIRPQTTSWGEKSKFTIQSVASAEWLWLSGHHKVKTVIQNAIRKELLISILDSWEKLVSSDFSKACSMWSTKREEWHLFPVLRLCIDKKMYKSRKFHD